MSNFLAELKQAKEKLNRPKADEDLPKAPLAHAKVPLLNQTDSKPGDHDPSAAPTELSFRQKVFYFLRSLWHLCVLGVYACQCMALGKRMEDDLPQVSASRFRFRWGAGGDTGSDVPGWAADFNALDLARDIRIDPDDKVNAVAGPAVVYAFASNILLWTFFMVFPALVYCGSTCDQSGGFAHASSVLLLLFIPFLIPKLRLEVLAMSYVMPGQFEMLGYETFTNGFPLGLLKRSPFPIPLVSSFYGWFVPNMLLSVSASLDIATSGMLVGKLHKTYMCDDNRVQRVWHETLAQSSIRDWADWLDLDHAVLIVWCFMSTQFLLALACSVPICNFRTLGYFCSCGEQDVDLVGYGLTAEARCGYATVLNSTDHNYHGEMPLQSLAASARMGLLTASSAACIKARLANTHVIFRPQCWLVELQRSVPTFVVFFLLQTCGQVQLQSSILAVTRAVSQDDTPDYTTFFTVLVSIGMGMKGLCGKGADIYCMWRELQNARAPILADVVGSGLPIQEGWTEEMVNTANRERVDRLKMTGNVLFGIFLIASLLGATSIAYATVKTFAATFVCDQGVWNIGGCAHVEVE